MWKPVLTIVDTHKNYRQEFLRPSAYQRAKVHKYIGNYKDISWTVHLLRGKVINNLISILFVR